MDVNKDITQLVGKTPLVQINQINKNKCDIYVKLEYFNPLSSIKDRLALAMIRDAEEKGLLKAGSTIIEPTSGNTGIGLAGFGAILGYKVILTMPETMSEERKKILRALGAELVLTSGAKGMKGAIEKAEELNKEIKGSFMPQQFKNLAGPAIHKATTAMEIWEDTDGKVDIVVAGIGTGGTVTGIAQALKPLKPGFKLIGVEPKSSAVLSGEAAGPHKIQGIGAGFVPDILETGLLDEIITIEDAEAGKASRELMVKEGILAGISSGAAFAAALKVAEREENKNKVIVVILPDTSERYISTWLFD